MHRSIAVTAVALALAGCGLLPDSSLHYRDAEVIEPMTVPDGMVFIGEAPLYAVPRIDQRIVGVREGEDGFKAPRPPQLVAVAGDDQDDDAAPTPPPGQQGQAVLGKDGSGYPIIMMPTSFAWAWEKVTQALTQTDLRVTDRNRDQGVFFLTTPERYQLQPPQAQLKLSHTTNGIQVAVLNGEGTALAGKDSSLAILESVHREL
ncbi:outer membrane protein assembly factor BamC [Alloalcanivorax gelatiniphagus]|uniref:Outer membrane protein assembly factor BamC n=1 Tax=Alloalcanivorax gelatiniphagus TaxID=1194167 RepID=A0ABY2XR35_9GAMM|nr:outer membrane protein assembly factor BamC [Alloalcanivorax gelatiniphagus]TMW14486.1 outer membrane protein assembly factor BamC [Alloalcanivorax gelatiniphagus]